MTTDPTRKYLYRKWAGVVWLTLEVALISGNIFGFTSLFKVLPKYGVYDNCCASETPSNSTMPSAMSCDAQTEKYQV
jgi:hypothetical protein